MYLMNNHRAVKASRILLIAAGCLAVGLIGAGCGDDDTAKSADKDSAAMSNKDAATKQEAMDKKAMEKDAMEKDAMEKDTMEKDVMEKGKSVESPHFVSSNPANGSSAPVGSVTNVTIDFDFDLGKASKIAVTAGGADMTTGATKIVGDNLQLMVPVNTSKASVYDVAYTACWPDGSCHDGSFSFTAAA